MINSNDNKNTIPPENVLNIETLWAAPTSASGSV
jgi:hypothetical protein